MFAIFISLLAAAFRVLLIKVAWAYSVVHIFHLPNLTWVQAWALGVLAHALFGGLQVTSTTKKE